MGAVGVAGAAAHSDCSYSYCHSHRYCHWLGKQHSLTAGCKPPRRRLDETPPAPPHHHTHTGSVTTPTFTHRVKRQAAGNRSETLPPPTPPYFPCPYLQGACQCRGGPAAHGQAASLLGGVGLQVAGAEHDPLPDIKAGVGEAQSGVAGSFMGVCQRSGVRV